MARRRRRRMKPEERAKKVIEGGLKKHCKEEKTWTLKTRSGVKFEVAYYKCSERDIEKIANELEKCCKEVLEGEDPVKYVRKRTKIMKRIED